ncbi:hypothetical protein M569_13852, partial [Genlisea aurea]
RDDEIDEGGSPSPYVGMEFKSEDEARRFYHDYARRVGFVVRIMQRRCSEMDGRTLARRLGCNKQGFSPPTTAKGKKKVAGRRASAREGCKATILFKLDKSGNWAVTRFVKEHNHPLVVLPTPASHSQFPIIDKDKKIQQLTLELKQQEELCSSYRNKLLSLLDCIQKQTDELSSKLLTVSQNIRKGE